MTEHEQRSSAEQAGAPEFDAVTVGAGFAGKPRVFMPYLGVGAYAAKCEEVVAGGYSGFVLGART